MTTEDKASPSIEVAHAEIERARGAWRDAFDAIRDPIFVHDREFRIVRANRAYAAAAGMDIRDVIGKRYWEVFPKNPGPLPGCARHMEKAEEEEEEEEEVTIPETGKTFVLRSFIVHGDTGTYVHHMEDVTDKRRTQSRIEVLLGSIEDLSTELDLDKLGQKAVEAAARVAGGDIGLACLREPADGLFHHRWLTGLSSEAAQAVHGRPIPPGEGITGLVVATGRGQLIADYPAYAHALPEMVRLGVKSAIAAPIRVGDAIEGILSVASRRAPFATDFLPLLDAITRQLGVAVQRHQAQEALRESEERQRSMSAAAQDAMLMLDDEGRIVYWNPAAERIFGYDAAEVLGREAHPVLAPARYQEDFRRGWAHFRGAGEGPVIGKVLELSALRKDGTEFPVELSVSALRLKGRWHALGILRDITERKRAEEALRESERAYRTLAENLPGIVYRVFAREGNRMEFYNKVAEQVTGYTPDELGAGEVCMIEPLILEEDRPDVVAEVKRAVTQDRPFTVEYRLRHKDGGIRYLLEQGRPIRGTDGKPLYIDGVIFDVTQRKQAEKALHRANRALKALSACNAALIHAENEHELLDWMCRIVVEEGGYRLTWVGFVEHDEEKSVRPVAHAGFEAGYLETLRITWADTERGRGPTGLAIRTGQPRAARHIQTDPHFAPWRAQALKRGYASSLALPLKEEDGEVFAVLNIYAAEPDAFDREEIKLLQELADDLAFGLLTLRLRNDRNRLQEEHLKSGERLKAALTDTIRVIALTVEKRDPYTAGHQQKVAALCVAIGRELGLPEDRLEGLRLGALIHDIGKVYIPAEILNRPGKLTDAEFEIIKSHPEVGYDIVKDVKFPWPVAQMILQHHERLDGSGYPKGLKGEAIILEARILAVADTVEAMASHRPYRPAHGIEAALAHIQEKRGTWYDLDAVDACVKLFLEKRFAFEEG